MTSANVSEQASNPENAEIGRLLGIDLAMGTLLLGLENDTFMQDVIAEVGKLRRGLRADDRSDPPARRHAKRALDGWRADLRPAGPLAARLTEPSRPGRP